ncbi:MAG TPA: DnaA N-terminal domain-containing protein [Kiritimatiellia bacterium]|nr:DnaA N-terminal domain-containing protein [Kiritimatiellia bacterium]
MEAKQAKQTWAKACEYLTSAISTDVYNRWIGVIEAIGDDRPGQLTLTVPNGFYQDWLEEHYLPMIRKALGISRLENLTIVFTVDNSRPPAEVPAATRPAVEKDVSAKRKVLKTCNVAGR